MVIGNTICLFESLIDALSYFDIYKNFIEGRLVSTNGKMMMTKVINFAIKIIYLIYILALIMIKKVMNFIITLKMK
jgi:hypothetical protein